MENDSDVVEVPDTPYPLTHSAYQQLRATFPSDSHDESFGQDLYTSVLYFVENNV